MTNKTAGGRKKILVLTSTFPRWEGDNEPPFVFSLCRRLATDFDVHVLAPHAPGARSRERISALEVHRFRYFFEHWEALAYRGGILANLKRRPALYLLVPFFLLFQMIAVMRIIRREGIDAVHAHWVIPQGLIAIAGKAAMGRRFPALLCTSHGTDLLGLPGQFFSLLKQAVLKRSDAVTVVGRELETHALLLGAAPEKLSVIPMGIDAAGLFVPPPAGEDRNLELLYVGRLVAPKAVDVLIKAMPAILLKHPAVRLSIAGDGPEKQALIALSEQLGIGNKIRFLGAVANESLPPLYRAAAVFVSPSLSEGFGLTLAEALACECAVVASDLPAARDMIGHGKTGFLASPGSPEDLARHVSALLADPALRQTFGRAGRELVLRRFDWEVIANNYASLLHQLTMNGTR